MAWTKMKTAAVTGVVILLAAGTTVLVKTVLSGEPDIQGSWMTSVDLDGLGVHAGESPKTRLVVKVSKANGVYRVTGDIIDQGIKDVPISNFTYHDGAIHAEMDYFGYAYDGKLNEAVTEIHGQMKQSGGSLPLAFKRTTTPPDFPEPLSDDDFALRDGSDLQGSWSGSIGQGANGLRINVKIAEPTDGTYRADFFVPDQGNGRQPTRIVYEKPTVKLIIMAGYGMFEGELKNDRKTMTGNWVQGGRLTPTTLTRANFAAPDLSGVGLVLRADERAHSVRVVGTIPNSPAAEAGLSAGFIVQKIDGVSTADMTLQDCVNLIRGAAGTAVRLELVSPDQKETKVVELMRRKIQI